MRRRIPAGVVLPDFDEIARGFEELGQAARKAAADVEALAQGSRRQATARPVSSQAQDDPTRRFGQTARGVQDLALALESLARGNATSAIGRLAAGLNSLGTARGGGSFASLAQSVLGGGKGAAPGTPDLNEFAGIPAASGEASEALGGLAKAAGVAGAVIFVGTKLEKMRDDARAKALERANQAIRRFEEAVDASARALQGIANAAVTTGSKPADITALARFGIGPAEGAQMANAFRAGTGPNASPEALLGLSRLGLTPQVPVAFGGPTNNAALLNRALERLEKLPEAERFRVASSVPGLEGALPYLNVSGDVAATRRRRSGAETGILDARSAQSGRDFMEAARLASEGFDLLKVAAAKGAVEPIERGMLAIADSLTHLAEFVNAHPEIARFFGELVERGLKFVAGTIDAVATGLEWLTKLGAGWNSFLEGAYKFLQETWATIKALLPGGNLLPGLPDLPHHDTGTRDPLAQAMNDLQKAVEENTKWMKPGWHGGGDRFHSALPPGMRGDAYTQWLKGMRRAFGAFS